MKDRPIRIAIVGLGKIAADQHVPAIDASGEFDLVATVDPGGGGTGQQPHFRDFADLQASGIAVDAVAICTPPRLRADLAQKALQAGFHVMLEKPPAASTQAARALIDAASQAGRTLFAAWHSREAAGVGPAREWLSGKTVHSVAIAWREDVRVWHPGQAWIFEENGFGVFDPAINALSILTAIMPGDFRVTAAKLDIPENCAAPIAGWVAMTGAGAIPVMLEMDFLQSGEQTWDIEVKTDAGPLCLRCGGSVLVTPEGTVKSHDAEYPRLYAHFARLVRNQGIDADLAPLTLVETALDIAERHRVAPFVD